MFYDVRLSAKKTPSMCCFHFLTSDKKWGYLKRMSPGFLSLHRISICGYIHTILSLVTTWFSHGCQKKRTSPSWKWGLGDDNPLTLGMILPYNIPSFMMVGAREFLPSFFQRSHPRGAHPSAQWDPRNPVILNGCLGRLGRRNIHHCPMCW